MDAHAPGEPNADTARLNLARPASAIVRRSGATACYAARGAESRGTKGSPRRRPPWQVPAHSRGTSLKGETHEALPDGRRRGRGHGLTGVVGVAVDCHGTVYVSNVLEGAPEGPPSAEFDPATVGEMTRISPDGTRATSDVTMPTGLELERGKLYASARSVASFVGLPPGSGEVQRIGDGAFTAAPGR